MTRTHPGPKPAHWFRTLDECGEITSNPMAIEYLNIDTGEAFVHTLGTAYWSEKDNALEVDSLKIAGITHWRLRNVHDLLRAEDY